jgi:hypothetical protein
VDEIFRTFQTDPGVHPASYTVGTGSLSRVKPPRSGLRYPPASRAEIKETVELYFSPPLRSFMAGYRVKFAFYITYFKCLSWKFSGRVKEYHEILQYL